METIYLSLVHTGGWGYLFHEIPCISVCRSFGLSVCPYCLYKYTNYDEKCNPFSGNKWFCPLNGGMGEWGGGVKAYSGHGYRTCPFKSYVLFRDPVNWKKCRANGMTPHSPPSSCGKRSKWALNYCWQICGKTSFHRFQRYGKWDWRPPPPVRKFNSVLFIQLTWSLCCKQTDVTYYIKQNPALIDT